MKREYEMFADDSYYGMWCVKEKDCKDFNNTWHFSSKLEAIALIDLLNRAK